jgi:signal transduction histidine kinase
MKVLIAEDDRISRMVLERYLQKWNFETVSVESGGQAWDLFQRGERFDIAILDWMMPEYTGIELCRKFREKHKNDIHIILLTSKSSKADMIQAFEAGVDDFVIKPFDPLELGSRLKAGRRLVESRKLLHKKNLELENYAKELESLADERAQMLMHQDRLASLGTLTAGVAHEVNNPATFISGNAQTLERMWQLMEPLINEQKQNASNPKQLEMVVEEFPKMISGIREGVRRISSIVNGLKAFARTSKAVPEPIDIHQCIENALLIGHNRLKYNITIERHFEEDLPRIIGEAQHLEQVFLNLFVNAADAMEKALAQGHRGLIEIKTITSDEKLQVTVRDTGPGIPKSRHVEIWKPFFTTKEAGKGTGLGLSISQNIIASHGGSLTVNNHPEGGAVFTLLFPLKKDGAS